MDLTFHLNVSNMVIYYKNEIRIQAYIQYIAWIDSSNLSKDKPTNYDKSKYGDEITASKQ